MSGIFDRAIEAALDQEQELLVRLVNLAQEYVTENFAANFVYDPDEFSSWSSQSFLKAVGKQGQFFTVVGSVEGQHIKVIIVGDVTDSASTPRLDCYWLFYTDGKVEEWVQANDLKHLGSILLERGHAITVDQEETAKDV